MASYKISREHRKFLKEIGRKGGFARAKRLTSQERREIASKAGSAPKKRARQRERNKPEMVNT
jgi:hypothetical protein